MSEGENERKACRALGATGPVQLLECKRREWGGSPVALGGKSMGAGQQT